MCNRFVSISNGYECCKVITFNSIQKKNRLNKNTETNHHETTKKRKKRNGARTKQNEPGIVFAVAVEFGLLKLTRWRRTAEVLIYTCSQYTLSLEHG